MRSLFMVFARLVLGAAMLGPMALAAQPAGTAQAPVISRLLKAIAQDNYAGFIANGTPQFAAITPEQFDAVAAQVGPRLSDGYRAEYLGKIRQQGHEMSVWKIAFDDGGDDLLATLSVSEGKVSGFFLR
nr:hypothetical protein [Pseudomonas sp.]